MAKIRTGERVDSTKPKNTAGMEFFDVEGYEICSWGPNPDGRPPQNQVHLLYHIKQIGPVARRILPIVLRMHSRNAIQDLIDLLSEYRDIVWCDDGSLTPWAEHGIEADQ